MEAPLTLHCFNRLGPQQNLQSFYNLRRTHFSMRFARSKNLNHSPQPAEETAFPVVVNNRIRSFKSERCVKFAEELDSLESSSPEQASKKKSPKKRMRETLYQARRERPPESPSAMVETMRIKKVGLTLKETDRMRRTEVGFQKRGGFCRRTSLLTYLPREGRSQKRERICGWETPLQDYF